MTEPTTNPAALPEAPREAETAHPLAHVLLAVIALFAVSAFLWARVAELDEVTVGAGRIIPSSQVQVVQNLEGGILEELPVREGSIVKKGDVVARLDDTRFTSSLRENRARYLALLAASARLRAEAGGRAPQFPPELKGRPDLVRDEHELFAARRKALEESLQALERSLEMARTELGMIEPAVERGSISEVELLRLKRQVNDLAGGIEERRNRFRADARQELSRTLAEMETLNESGVAADDRVRRTVVRSPVHGVVKRIAVKTIGAVVPPGGELMEIVPLEDTLLVEARVKPGDIGFIALGQPASVKIGAYDYSIYGPLEAKVEHISADALEDRDPREGSYYRVLVRTSRNYLEGRNAKHLQIIPGMTATVDILTGKKTVLRYLLKPLIKVQERALRER